jgi:hypothetical protein
VWHYFPTIAITLKQHVMTANLFRKESSISRMANAQELGLIATRIYIVLLLGGMLLFALFTGLIQVAVSNTVSSPSLGTFEYLQGIYPTTLSCPCQQINIPYRTYLSLMPMFHQVSDGVSTDFVYLLFICAQSSENPLSLT